jgi:hypothetical protein
LGKMKKFVCIVFLAFCDLRAADIWPNAEMCPAAEIAEISRKITPHDGKTFEAVFEITSKGNGLVTLPGLAVRVYDDHDDGWIFSGSLLRCEWLARGDVLEFVISGIALRTHEKNQSVQESVSVRATFRYAPKTRSFVPVECSPQIDFWKR